MLMWPERRAGNEMLEAKMVCDCGDDCVFEAAHNPGVETKAAQTVTGCKIYVTERWMFSAERP